MVSISDWMVSIIESSLGLRTDWNGNEDRTIHVMFHVPVRYLWKSILDMIQLISEWPLKMDSLQNRPTMLLIIELQVPS